MKTNKMKIISTGGIILMSLVVNQSASASQGRGGADTVVCSSSLTLADLSTLKDPVLPQILEGYEVSDIEAGVLNYLRIYRGADFPSVQSALSEFTFSKSSAPLENLDTGVKIGLFSRIFGCSKEQLAIQNFETGEVLFDENRYEMLSKVEKVLLKIHEAYVRIGWKEGMSLIDMEEFARTKTGSVWNDFENLKIAITSARPSANFTHLGHTPAIFIVSYCAGTSPSNLPRTLSQLGVVTIANCLDHLTKKAGYSCDPSLTHDESPSMRLINYVTNIQGCFEKAQD